MANKPYYQGMSLALLTFGLSLGTFIQVLDTSIANVSIPNIAGDLGVSTDEGTWVITSFSVSNAIVLPLTGWLADRFGRVKLFIWSLIFFSITSFLCGIAPNLELLIFFRVLQGAVAGSLIPLSQSLLLASNKPESQGTAIGIWAMVVIVAPVLGPILGGWLTFTYGWPWIFFINVPLGFLSAAITWHLLKDRETEIIKNPIDYTGLALLAICVGTLQVMLDKGQDLDWFNSNYIWAMAIVSFITFVYFIIWDKYTAYPIVNFSFFRDRNFLIGTMASAVGYMIFFGSTVLLPLWLQTYQGYTPLWAGWAVAPIGVIPVMLSPLVGKYSIKLDSRMLVSFSFFAFGLTFFWFSNLITDVGYDEIFWPRLAQGVGVTFFFIPLVQLAMSGIKPRDLASASGVFNFIRIFAGGAFGTSVFVTLWDRQGIRYHSWIAEKVTNYSSITTQAYQGLDVNFGLTGDAANAFMDMAIDQQAYMLSLNDMFYLCGWVFLAMIPILWLCKNVKGVSIGNAAGE